MQDIKNKIKGALTYPALVFFVLVVAIMGVMLYVIPRLMPLFESTGAELPFVTESLIVVSNIVREWFWIILLFLVGGVIALKVWFASYE